MAGAPREKLPYIQETIKPVRVGGSFGSEDQSNPNGDQANIADTPHKSVEQGASFVAQSEDPRGKLLNETRVTQSFAQDFAKRYIDQTRAERLQPTQKRWHRAGRLKPGQIFSTTWSCDGEPTSSISVRSELDAVVLTYRACTSWAAEWKRIKQRVPITWTDCHFGGRRPWFVCAVYSGGRYCGRRVAVLYGAGELFACRSCYGLAYESQQQDPPDRAQLKAQKIRMRLGGSWCPADLFPDKPKGMHWRTYERLCEAHDLAEARFFMTSMRRADRLQR